MMNEQINGGSPQEESGRIAAPPNAFGCAQPQPVTPPAYGTYATMPARGKQGFDADRTDAAFAIAMFAIGFLFVRWVFLSWQGWGVAAFAAVYCGSILLYLRKKNVRIARGSWFYFAAVLLTALSYALFENNSLEPVRSLFLLCAAAYWVLSATGTLLLGKTGNWIILDGINALFVLPFGNFGCQYRSIGALRTKREGSGKRVGSIALGVLLALVVGGMVLPLLLEADSGGFTRIADAVAEYFRWITRDLVDVLWEAALAVPVAAYLFGLIAGSAHKRRTDSFNAEGVAKGVDSLRILPESSVMTLLGMVCALYAVFIASQLPYFFSAFTGVRPAGWQVYSEYARQGFFELCGIAAINLTLLLAVNCLCKKPRKESAALRWFNVALALLTLVLIATAMSKMALYIGAYGLTVTRLLPCVFMAFLIVVFIGVIAMQAQKREFSIVRLAMGVGATLLCALCLVNPDGLCANYNAQRYLSGTLPEFDTQILYRSGAAGVDSALLVYDKTGDPALKTALGDYLRAQRRVSGSWRSHRDSLQKANARSKADAFTALHPAQ